MSEVRSDLVKLEEIEPFIHMKARCLKSVRHTKTSHIVTLAFSALHRRRDLLIRTRNKLYQQGYRTCKPAVILEGVSLAREGLGESLENG